MLSISIMVKFFVKATKPAPMISSHGTQCHRPVSTVGVQKPAIRKASAATNVAWKYSYHAHIWRLQNESAGTEQNAIPSLNLCHLMSRDYRMEISRSSWGSAHRANHPSRKRQYTAVPTIEYIGWEPKSKPNFKPIWRPRRTLTTRLCGRRLSLWTNKYRVRNLFMDIFACRSHK